MPVTAVSTSENTGYPPVALGFDRSLPMEVDVLANSSVTPMVLDHEQENTQYILPQAYQNYPLADLTQTLTSYLKENIGAIDKLKPNKIVSPTSKGTTASWLFGKKNTIHLSGDREKSQEIDVDLNHVVERFTDLREKLKLRRNYIPIGWHKAPYGERRTQEKIRKFWVFHSDPSDFRWLLTKASTEYNVEVLDALSDILSERISSDPTLVSDVLSWLQRTNNVAFQESILRAFQWISVEELSRVRELLEILTRFSKSEDETIREAVYFATRALPDAMAAKLLREASASETDTALQDVISEELAIYEE